MKGGYFGIEKIYYKFHKATLKQGGTYIPTPNISETKKQH